MKFLIIISLIISLSLAQRPSFAGSSPKGRPGLASRFKVDTTDEPSTTNNIVNRLGEDGTTIKIPVDARGDYNLVNRISTWPRDQQPFWYLNAQHIEAQRNPQKFNNQQQQQNNNNNLANRGNFAVTQPDDYEVPQFNQVRPIRPVEQRSSFLGPLY